MKTIVDTADGIHAVAFAPSPEPLAGMAVLPLHAIVDGRGGLTELWSAPWMKTRGVVKPEHIYQSATDYGVVKAWHLHRRHTDQFAVTRGKLQVVCADARRNSPTFARYFSILAGTHQPVLIKIPPGIVHGWKALSVPEALVLNLQSHPYDPTDELRFPWDGLLAHVWEPIFR